MPNARRSSGESGQSRILWQAPQSAPDRSMLVELGSTLRATAEVASKGKVNHRSPIRSTGESAPVSPTFSRDT
jgi:hypothetical protein